MSQWLTVADAATAMGVSERTVRRLAASGSLEAKQIGGRKLIRRESVPVTAGVPETGLPPETALVARGLRDLLSALLGEQAA